MQTNHLAKIETYALQCQERYIQQLEQQQYHTPSSPPGQIPHSSFLLVGCALERDSAVSTFRKEWEKNPSYEPSQKMKVLLSSIFPSSEKQ